MKFLHNFIALVLSAHIATAYDPRAAVDKCFEDFQDPALENDEYKEFRNEYDTCNEKHSNNPVCETACQLDQMGMIVHDGFIIKDGDDFYHNLQFYARVDHVLGDSPAPPHLIKKYKNGSNPTVSASTIIQNMFFEAGDRILECLKIDEIPFPHLANGLPVVPSEGSGSLNYAIGCETWSSEVMEAVEHYIKCFENAWEPC